MKKLMSVAMLMLCIQWAQAQMEEEKAVKATILKMFDAMRAGDSTLLGQTFHKEMMLKSVVADKEGNIQLRESKASDFLKAVGTPHDKVWDERISSWEIRVDGALATAWTDYSFYAGEQFSHCGVNAFQLIKQDGVWRIFHVADTRRKDNCN